MIRLSELLRALPSGLSAQREGSSDLDPAIGGVRIDSRRVRPGDLFVALRGANADGHDHLAEAQRLGAVALLVERLPAGFEPGGIALARVPDTRRALAPLSARFFGHPGRELTLIGVTGTNGKTSVTVLVESILARAGRRVGVIGTVETRWPGHHQRALNTTPESLELQETLRAMRTAGVDHVAMEVSSHGLALGRVAGLMFRVAALTNLTQDHLDFHETMESYRDAKLLLFRERLAADAVAVVNVDDPSAPHFLAAAERAGARCLRVSRRADADAELRLEDARVALDGTQARLATSQGPLELSLPLVGDFNLENALVAVGIGLGLGLGHEAIARGIASCPQVPGRVERVAAEVPNAPVVFVDYAHTPDAVEKLLRTLRPLTRGRLIVLFGCGGDRDRGKRPQMAEAVARHADLAIATSDNPRTEDPAAILRDVEAGLAKLSRVTPERLVEARGAYTSLVDRREAIALAMRVARGDDTVVLAGKGHEDYQILGTERVPFDDREEARRALEGARA